MVTDRTNMLEHVWNTSYEGIAASDVGDPATPIVYLDKLIVVLAFKVTPGRGIGRRRSL